MQVFDRSLKTYKYLKDQGQGVRYIFLESTSYFGYKTKLIISRLE
jgi:hypothetical protein